MGVNASVHTAWEYRPGVTGVMDVGIQVIQGTGVISVNASVHTAWEYRPGVTGVMDVGIQVIQGLLGLWV